MFFCLRDQHFIYFPLVSYFYKNRQRNKMSNKPRSRRTPITSSLLNKHLIFAE